MGYKVKIIAGDSTLFVSSFDSEALFYTYDINCAGQFEYSKVDVLRAIYKGIAYSPFISGYDLLLKHNKATAADENSPTAIDLELKNIEFIE